MDRSGNLKTGTVYGWILVLGGIYYAILFALSHSDINESWGSWAVPVNTREGLVTGSEAYWLLALVYILAVGTPLIMIGSGVVLLRGNRLPIIVAIALCTFLLLASLVGKLILLVGALIFAYMKSKIATSA